MNYFIWKKNYETGIKSIDEQHRKLFLLVNNYFTELFSDNFSPKNNFIYEVLKELDSYYEFHFIYERTIYSKEFISKYFGNENVLKSKINEILGKSKEDNFVQLYGFAEFLRKWLIKHVLILNKDSFKELMNNSLKISCN